MQVLDLHKNCLEKLPEEIGQLKNLRVKLILTLHDDDMLPRKWRVKYGLINEKATIYV